jgi:uncharacterized RDD family membrane protein YckC
VTQSDEHVRPMATYAGFWKRCAAALIDWTLCPFLLGLLSVSLALLLGLNRRMHDPDLKKVFGTCVQILTVVGVWLYFAVSESSIRQATPGKMCLGIKVSDLAGERIGFGRATGRHFAKYLSGLIAGYGFLMAGFTRKKQTLHDEIAGCLVVNRE